MRTFAALVSLCFLFSAEAHQGRPRGKQHPQNHHHQTRDCSGTFVARTQADLVDYENLRIQSGVDRNLHINTDINATDLRIQTDCEIKIHSRKIINVTGVFSLFVEKIDFGNKSEIRAKDFYVKSERMLKLDDHLLITVQRLYLESAEEIRFKNNSILTADLGIFNAPVCDVKPRATRLVTQELGTCFGKAPFYVDLTATPLSGDAPLNVNFDASKSFGLADSFVYHFGTGDTLQTLNEGAAYVYVTPGSFSARLEVKGSFGSLFSPSQTILVNPPVITDYEIFHDIVRINPPAVIYSTREVPALENLKEFLWDFGDNSSIAIPFTFSQVGFAFHDYAAEADYTVRLRLKDQANYVTPAIEKVVSTFADALPVPRYAINTFKGEAPLTVDVQALEATDAYGEPMRFQWFFTDTMENIALGSTRQVQHTFTQPGIYQIQLGLTDSRGAVRSVLIPIYVGQANSLTSLPPFPIIDSTERYGEAPLTVDFTAVGSFDPDGAPGQPLTYQWTFFDNGRNQNVSFFGQNFSYTFIKPAVAQVRLIVTDVTGQQGSTVIPVYVSGPTSNPGGFIVTAGAGPRTYNFNINPFMIENTYSYESILWDFGDRTQSRFQNTPHVFPSVGDYPVTLKIRKLDGDFETYTQVVQVSETPIAQTASISTNGNRYNLNEPKTFNAITNRPHDAATAKFTWHFGDGSSVSGIGTGFSSVSHVYSNPGQYRVTLHTQFATGLANYAQLFMNPNTAPTLGEVKIYRLPAIAPATVGFAPVETATDPDGFVQTYVYEFGDGSIPVITNQGYLEHTYQLAGTYPVSITAIDNNGGRATRTFNFTVLSNQVPIAGITIYPQTSLIAPARIGFAGFDQSSDGDGYLTQYEYDFGDGDVITTAEGYVEHDYPTAGTYRLGLRVQDDKGVWSEKAFYDLVIAANQIPIAINTIYTGDYFAPATVFMNAGVASYDVDGFITLVEYVFGDGNTVQVPSSEAYVGHQYLIPGNYIVQVRVKDDAGAWSDFSFNSIEIFQSLAPVLGDIPVFGDLNKPAPTRLGFGPGGVTTSNHYPVTYVYDFGDGTIIDAGQVGYLEHTFENSGTYTVTITAKDSRNQSSSKSVQVTIKENQPPTLFGLNIYGSFNEPAPLAVRFDMFDQILDDYGQIASIHYDFGDGNTTSSLSFVEHTYQASGAYLVVVTVTDAQGAIARISRQVVINANQPPVALALKVFKADSPLAPVSIGVAAYESFQDLDGFITNYIYDFGDGRIETTANGYLEHTYFAAGSYLVKVTAFDNKGASVYSSSGVVVRTNTAPISKFTLPKSTISTYEVFTLDADTESFDQDGDSLTYTWEFGDGSSSTFAYPSHYYAETGTYIIKLIARDPFGEISQYEQSIVVEESGTSLPVPKIALETDNTGLLRANAEGSFSTDGSSLTYTWDFGDGKTSSDKFTVHNYYEPGAYNVRLTVSNESGLSQSVVRTIVFSEPLAEVNTYSPGILEIVSGPRSGIFNPISQTITLSVSNDVGFGDREVLLNGIEIATTLDEETNQISALLVSKEGLNRFEFSGVDAAGRTLETSFEYYSGSKTVTFQVQSADGASLGGLGFDVILPASGQEKMKTFSYAPVQAGAFTISNLPRENLIVKSQGSVLIIEKIAKEQTDILLKEIPWTPASVTENDDFSLGIEGWRLKGSAQILTYPNGKKALRVFNTGNYTEIAKTLKAGSNDLSVFSRLKSNALEDDIIVAISRTESGEVSFKAFTGKELQQILQAGLGLSLSLGEGLDNEVIFRIYPYLTTSGFNFLDIFKAFAQESTSAEVEALRRRDIEFINMDFIAYASINPPYTRDIPKPKPAEYQLVQPTPLSAFSIGPEFSCPGGLRRLSAGINGGTDLTSGIYDPTLGNEIELTSSDDCANYIYLEENAQMKLANVSSVNIAGLLIAQMNGGRALAKPTISTINSDEPLLDQYLGKRPLFVLKEPGTLTEDGGNVSFLAVFYRGQPRDVTLNEINCDSDENFICEVIGPATLPVLVSTNSLSESGFRHIRYDGTWPGTGGRVLTYQTIYGGDHWAHPQMAKLLRSFTSSATVGDLSRANGGQFYPHTSGHQIGLNVDVVTTNHNRANKTVESFWRRLEDLRRFIPSPQRNVSSQLEDYDIRKIGFSITELVNGEYVADNENQDSALDYFKNRCIVSHSANIIRDIPGHATHWHIELDPIKKNVTNFLSEATFVELESDEDFVTNTYQLNENFSNVLAFDVIMTNVDGVRELKWAQNTEPINQTNFTIKAVTGQNQFESGLFQIEYDSSSRRLNVKVKKSRFSDIVKNHKIIVSETNANSCKEHVLKFKALGCDNEANGWESEVGTFTEEGGFVSDSASIDERAVINRDVSVCGSSEVGPNVELSGHLRVSSSSINTLVEKSIYSALSSTQGNPSIIEGSTINSKINAFNYFSIKNTVIEGRVSQPALINSSLIQGSKIIGRVEIINASVTRSVVDGGSGDVPPEAYLRLAGTITDAKAWGYGIIEGILSDKAKFAGRYYRTYEGERAGNVDNTATVTGEGTKYEGISWLRGIMLGGCISDSSVGTYMEIGTICTTGGRITGVSRLDAGLLTFPLHNQIMRLSSEGMIEVVNSYEVLDPRIGVPLTPIYSMPEPGDL